MNPGSLVPEAVLLITLGAALISTNYNKSPTRPEIRAKTGEESEALTLS